MAKTLRQAAINKYSNLASNVKTSKNEKSSDVKTTSDVATTFNEINSDEKKDTLFIKDIQLDLSYYAKIIIGNQEFNILLDTGSSNLWIPNKDCTSAACQNHNRFNPSSSPTFKKEGNPWSIQYGTGFASGITGIDNVKIGRFTADNQIFGLANNISDFFIPLENDGILGLAFDSLNTIDNGTQTLISTLIKQKKIRPIFSFHFQRALDFDDQGTFTLGGVDKTKFKGEITFNPLNSIKLPLDGFWVINLDDAIVDSKPLSFLGKAAIIDTGTSILILPDNDTAAIHNQIPGAVFDSQDDLYIIPCDTTAVVAFRFGGVDFSIQSKDLILAPISGTDCISSIIPSGDSLPSDVWLLGQTFLRNVYSVFDVKNKKVGFAHNK
ncbi:13917_t:CDS:1 [Cetraspora pellucida]|uniref:rhizopuspepsin n=1 Tax=Cetraspora pellucida TaxID=1433469 RepID=A0A9N9JN26_9GLOM|nr:13917_t:CDS:1 [Cetraspora pellucida]